ncbi:conserved protein of unknown function [Candidatus Hydrogenisulfobacillus filiaventi]|uniref:CRISPR type III-associated protein domain-containing protein n=1 Tax=Candidatus Hydrogenisulfobacillus filiaventi TaxID=2707344 RepID=A0A6F8ZDI1_9FIRM|nr:conserved protein of unknown function [Candidatus Hydrogenisulfobacillus filiaventi]
MARFERYRVQGILTAHGPIRVGGAGGGPGIDLLPAANGMGQWILPGSSVAGALRAVDFRLHAQDGLENQLRAMWGPLDEDQRPLGASRIWVEDAVTKEQAVAEIRDGVGIHRRSGAAAARIKYNQLVLPAGTRFAWEMRWDRLVAVDDGEQPDPTPEAWLFPLLFYLVSRGLPLGGGKTRGLGWVRLKKSTLQVRREDWSTREGAWRALAGGEPVGLTWPSSPGDAGRLLTITVEWDPDGPVLVAAGGQGIGVDTVPLTTRGPDGKRYLVLPGSSLKGVLRSHAERIVRTVIGPCEETKKWLDLHDRFEALLDVPLVRELFGSPRRKSPAAGSEAAAGMMGALRVEDVRSTVGWDEETWEAITAKPQEQGCGHQPSRVGEGVEDDTLQLAQHVAIDRFTGGAAPGLLYDVLEPHRMKWKPWRLQLDLARLPQLEQPALALLLLVLDDVAAGRVGIGFGTQRGHGVVRIRRVTVEPVPEDWPGRPKWEAGSAVIRELPSEVRDWLRRGWETWWRPLAPSSKGA